MEYINKVELQGVVGSVRISDIGRETIVRMTIATNHCYRAKDGSPVIETTWTNVAAIGSKVDPIVKGSKVRACGRLRNTQYTGADGEQRSLTEVVAYEVKLLSD